MSDEHRFTKEQAKLAAVSAGLDLDRPLSEQLESEPEQQPEQIGSPEEEFAKALARGLSEASSTWHSIGGRNGQG